VPKIQKKTAKKAESDWMTECHFYGHCHTKYSDQYRRKCLQLTVWDEQDPLVPWADVEAALLPQFIKQFPGRRPWSWWRASPERRRRRVGESGRREKDAQFEFEVPYHCWFIDCDETDPPRYESQSSYLQRNGLLSAREEEFLRAYPELLTPEKIEVWLETGPEVKPLGGGSYYEDNESV
jgi:hypothetical protein